MAEATLDTVGAQVDNQIVTAALAVANARDKQQLLATVFGIIGDGLVYMADAADTTATTDLGPYGRVWTHSSSIAARKSALGLGYAVSFDPAADQATVPDAAEHSAGDGTVDVPFSVGALGLVNDTAIARTLIAKYQSANREWKFDIAGNKALRLSVYDESVDLEPNRVSNAAVINSAWTFWGGTYAKATGGAVAADEMTLYENGKVKASTATNQGSYVAMENTTQVVSLGSVGATGGLRFSGSMAFAFFCKKALTAGDHWALHQALRGYFGVPLV